MLFTCMHKHVCPKKWISFTWQPPPPASAVVADGVQSSLRKQRERLGDLETYAEPIRGDSEQWAFDQKGAIDGVRGMIDALGETNPILKDLLQTAKDEIVASSGRRLMQRMEYTTKMTSVLASSEIVQFYGKGGIPGITSGSCEALCEAQTETADTKTDTELCRMYAFKRAFPHSHADKTGWCYLLHSRGACTIADFGVELYSRNIQSERQCSASAPGLDNPLCVGIPSTTDDSRILSHADATAIAFQVPDMDHPAPGSQGLPVPCALD